jgi:hypothetical protein
MTIAMTLLLFLSKKISLICQLNHKHYYYFHEGKVSKYQADETV